MRGNPVIARRCSIRRSLFLAGILVTDRDAARASTLAREVGDFWTPSAQARSEYLARRPRLSNG